ncbi:MAG: SDR family NAD(P)-dependent oxidoreductase [Bacteroidetes bacterium]|nr:MAG: SDR family NAD(P)-dependent oxidoreductase [Bacteroidota bacterium]
MDSKVVVVTGASAGVGRAIAHEFARYGSILVLMARNRVSLEGTVREVEELGGKAYYHTVDLAFPEQVERAASETEKNIGPIDIWINNAMNSVFSPFNQMQPDEFKRVTEVTYLGQVYGTMAALKYMLPRNRGKIVLVGSALAYRGIPLQSAYCGAKHGVQGMFDSLRSELIHDKSKVAITMVQLPALNTTQFGWVKSRLPNKPRPMGKIFQPEVAARAIRYAAQHNRREILVAFPTFKAVIGNKFFPGLLDRILAKNGIDGQQTSEPVGKERKHNLWEPVPGNHSAHGTFDHLAHSRSPLLWMSTHWRVVVLLTLLFILVIILIIAFKIQSPPVPNHIP